ncbi:MAG: FAD:protein FMN transferase [Frankiaceae bacterium]|nr:FAD:protein FMN transferase [Frankiaceae bacterium]
MIGERWRALGTDVHVLVSDRRALREAADLVARQLVELDDACSRFRDSELTRLCPGSQRVGPVLAGAVAAALAAAARTDGLVDPTLGRALVMAGYDRTFDALPDDGEPALPGPAGRWRDVHLDGDVLELPDVELDLGATAKAWAADLAAATITERLGVHALVNLGGDLAVSGGSWTVSVGDPGGPCEVVEVTSGLATSSTTRRTWRRGGRRQHHVLDPRTGSPAPAYWQTVTVAAATCVEANTASTAAIVLGAAAPAWLGDLPSRLVDAAGRVTYLGGWAA